MEESEKKLEKDEKTRLHEKHKKFIDYYLEDPAGGRVRAYIKVYGISNKSSAATLAGTIMKRPEVMAYLKDRQEQLSKARFKRILTTHESIRIKMELLCDAALENKQISSAIRALELIGKDSGLYQDRVRVSGDEENPTPIGVAVNHTVDLSNLSVEELKSMQQMLKKANKKGGVALS